MSKKMNVLMKLQDKFTKPLGNTTKELQKSRLEIKKGHQEINKWATAANSKFKSVASTAAKTIGTLGVTLGSLAAGVGFKEAFNMETYKAQLETATGDTQKAAEIMKYAIDMANKTPFEGGALVEAAAKFEAMGMSAEEWLGRAGDMAGATGKDIIQATEAIIDAQSGEWERMKEFGIKGVEDMDELVQVMNSRFAGGMEKLSTTTKGMWSTVTGGVKKSLAKRGGIMDGGTGAGMHMWNIVTLDGYNYLVDITNSDTGTLGQNGGLFLAGTSGDMDTGYTFQAGNANISYQYDEVQAELYGSEILTLASGDYTPSQPIPEVTASASVQNVTYGYASAPQISAVVQNADGAGYACRWYQVDDQGNAAPVDAASDPYTFILPTGLAAGTYTYYCEINAGGQAAVSNRVTITVEQAEVTPVISGTTTKEYHGTINGPEGISIELSGVISGDSVSAAAKSYAYNSPDPGSADRITASGITLEGADAGSYRLTAETVTASGTITDRAVMETPDEGQSKTEEPEDPAPESPAGQEEPQTDVPDDPQPSDSENKQDDAEENKQNKDDGNRQTDAEENKQSEDAGNKQTDAEENKQSEDAGNKQDKAAGNTQTPAPGNTKAGTSGNGQTTADVSRSPKTGDSMDSVMLYAALLVSCAAVIAAAAGRKRKIR